MFPETNQPIDIAADLVDLSHHRKAERTARDLPDPVIILVAYAQDELVYDHGRITAAAPETYTAMKNSTDPAQRNLLVNKFGLCYERAMPLLLHRRLADVIVDTAIDMRNRYHQFSVVMDGLRTVDSGERMQKNRPDLVQSGMLAKAGTSAHNRALAVDTKLFQLIDAQAYETLSGDVPLAALEEADEHGHLDDEQDMGINSRFYAGPMSAAARKNRYNRLVSWQRASVKNRTPIANLLAEFWDDRVPGSPTDMWRVLTNRAMCLKLDGNPTTNPHIASLKQKLNGLQTHNSRESLAQQAHDFFCETWGALFTPAQRTQLETLLGPGGGSPPPLEHFLFHEWLENIHDHHIKGFLP